MEHLIREFGAWLKQGFGWLVDVIVFGCLWGISQVSRLLGTHLGGAPILKIVTLLLVFLLLLYAFYWVFGRFIGVIRWALDRIAYALGVILFSAAVVSGVFASAGLSFDGPAARATQYHAADIGAALYFIWAVATCRKILPRKSRRWHDPQSTSEDNRARRRGVAADGAPESRGAYGIGTCRPSACRSLQMEAPFRRQKEIPWRRSERYVCLCRPS